ncbi:MAG: hypothetical protein ABI602_00655 [Candidatus Saccharibacteria bacterium]
MKIKNNVKLAVATVLSLSSVLTVAMPLAHAAVQTCTWTGTAADNKFSTAANWSGCGSGVPLTGDLITLGTIPPVGGSSNNSVHLLNDINTALGGVDLINDTSLNFSNYYLDSLKLAAPATIQATGTYTRLNMEPTAVVTTLGDLTISGTSFDVKSSAFGGNVTLATNIEGSNADFYLTGSTISGLLTIGSGSVAGLTSTTAGSFAVQINATLSLMAVQTTETLTAPLTLGGGSGSVNPKVNIYPVCDPAVLNFCSGTATTWTMTGPVVLLADSYFMPMDAATVNYSGALSGDFTLTKDPTSGGILNLNPSSNTSKSTPGLQTNPVKVTTVSDDQSSTTFAVVSNETLVVDGQAGYVSLNSGATLQGSGQIAGLGAGPGSTVAPGHSPGCLTSLGDIAINGTYQVDVGGTDACTGYDQMKVTGAVDVTGGTLDATLYGGFVPKVGQSYTIIDNDAADAVTGTFTGLAEGGDYTNQGVTYSVTYKGGDGNDVVLTVKSIDASKLPAKPDTGFALVAAHPLVSLATTTLAALGLVFAARKLKPVKK